jgi:hypothetical protein
MAAEDPPPIFDPPSSPGSSPPPPLQPPPPPVGYSPAPPQPYPTYPQVQPLGPPNGNATASLALGIAGLALLVTSTGLLAPVTLVCSIIAWVQGSKGLGRVRRGETNQGEGAARAGRICGIVGVVLGALGLLFWLAVLVAAVAGKGS